MSATGRKAKAHEPTERRDRDAYMTPRSAIDPLLDHLGPAITTCASPSQRMVSARADTFNIWDPCAGEGAILSAIQARGIKRTRLFANDIASRDLAAGWGVGLELPTANMFSHDFLTENLPIKRDDLVITNPPYTLALEFVQKALSYTDRVVMLLRLNWLASIRRADFLRANTPSIFVLPKRPSFTGKGTDACDYAWFAWGIPSTAPSTAHVVILGVK